MYEALTKDKTLTYENEALNTNLTTLMTRCIMIQEESYHEDELKLVLQNQVGTEFMEILKEAS